MTTITQTVTQQVPLGRDPSRAVSRSTSLFHLTRKPSQSPVPEIEAVPAPELLDWRQILSVDPQENAKKKRKSKNGKLEPEKPKGRSSTILIVSTSAKKQKKTEKVKATTGEPKKAHSSKPNLNQEFRHHSAKNVLSVSITSKDLAGINLMQDLETKSQKSKDTPMELSDNTSTTGTLNSHNNSYSSGNSPESVSSPPKTPSLPSIEDKEEQPTKSPSLVHSLEMKDDTVPPTSPDDSPPRAPNHQSEEVDFFDSEHAGFSCPAPSSLGLTGSNSSRRRSMDDCRQQLLPADYSREETPKHPENDQDLDWFSFLQEPVSVTDKTAKPKIGKGLYVNILEQRVKELEENILHLKRIAPSKPTNKLLKSTRVTQTILNPSTVERPLKIVKKRIEVGERISSGASLAVVYSCYVDGWLCAMKELNTENISSLDIQTFQEEIRLLEYLPKHPNVCQYLFHDYSDNKIRLFMTNYHTTLRSELDKREVLLQASDITVHAHDIIKGLEFLHRNSVIHRDLKAENVFGFLDPDEKICSLVIGDFDTAKRITNKEALNSVAGSPAWMAPEVLNANISGEEYSFPVDVYSFGMTLYEILSLKTPYESIPFLTLTEHILSGELPELPPTIEEDESYAPLLELYLGCIKHDAAARFTVNQIKTTLETLIPNPKLKHMSK